MYQKVKDYADYGKDPNVGAIININQDAYQAHIQKKKQHAAIETRLNALESRLDKLDKLTGLLERMLHDDKV